MSQGQSLIFKGIYEFEDLSGSLLAAKVPATGTVDLYDGTAIVVKPSQCALFVYNGQIADVLLAGVHQVKTENLPLLTRLANWQFGFQSPLRCELIFIAGQLFTSRRWGTARPVLTQIQGLGAVPMRAFGNYNVAVTEPKLFFTKLFGTRSSYSITEVEDLIQGFITESLASILAGLNSLEVISHSYPAISRSLEDALRIKLQEFGLRVTHVQVLSAIPSQEVIEAMESRAAIQILGSQKDYLLYKAANSLGDASDGKAADPMQVMMSLMLGKGVAGSDYHEKEKQLRATSTCPHCQKPLPGAANFCPHCGGKIA